MKILLCPDKFRGSMTAVDACRAMADGIRQIDPAIRVVSLPLADGGEGTTDALTAATGGQKHSVAVQGPLGQSIRADFGVSADGTMAFVELAAASGLHRLDPSERDALRANTVGTGQLLRAAIATGARRIILGLGGSATTDGGMGLAAALGYQFWDKQNQLLPSGGDYLAQVARISAPLSPPDGSAFTLELACDVTAPLYGPAGAACVYAPQKGASPDDVIRLDAGLRHWADLVGQYVGQDLADVPGAGAAGGAGFGAMAFLNATIRPGAELMMQLTGFTEQLDDAHLIITGEGKLDVQTRQGKLIAGITEQANRRGIPVIALCGTLDLTPAEITSLGLTYAASIIPRPLLLDEALQQGPILLRNMTANVVSLLTRSLMR